MASECLKQCRVPDHLERALWMAVVVGTVLSAINHDDMFQAGEYSGRRVVQLSMTYVVPFCVSLFSSAATATRSA